MTLTVCLMGSDGMVLCTDSRGTFGDPRGLTAQNDTLKKLFLIRNVGVMTAGSTQGNMIIEEIARVVDNENITNCTAIMEKIREVANSKFSDWFVGFPFFPVPGQNPAFVRPTVQFTIAGYDEENGEPVPRIYSMSSPTSFAPNLHEYGFALGGVPYYALYLLNRIYTRDQNVKSLQRLAAYVITETAEQDGKVGGPLQLATICPDGASKMIDSEHIKAIIDENMIVSQGLKDLFRME